MNSENTRGGGYLIGAVRKKTSQYTKSSFMSFRTSIELYRDLLRLVKHIAPGTTSPKSIALRAMIRGEFDKSRHLSPDSAADQAQIESLKANAVRALSNYMLYESGVQDKTRGGKLGSAMDRFHDRNMEDMNDSAAERPAESKHEGPSGEQTPR